jgi:hypothetical protein
VIELPGIDSLWIFTFTISEGPPSPCSQVATITGRSLGTVHRILERYLARTRRTSDFPILRTLHAQSLQIDSAFEKGEPEQKLQTGTNANVTTKQKKKSSQQVRVARPKRFELLTPRFVVWCSIQLSYGRLRLEAIKPLAVVSMAERAGLRRTGASG